MNHHFLLYAIVCDKRSDKYSAWTQLQITCSPGPGVGQYGRHSNESDLKPVPEDI